MRLKVIVLAAFGVGVADLPGFGVIRRTICSGSSFSAVLSSTMDAGFVALVPTHDETTTEKHIAIEK